MAFGDLVQAVVTNYSGGSNSVGATLGSTATAGNLIVACQVSGDATLGISTSGFVKAAECIDTGDTDGGAIYYKISVGGEDLVTTTATNAKAHGIAVMEFEGPFAETPLDQIHESDTYAVGDATVEMGPTPTLSTSSSLAIAFGMWNKNVAYTTTWSDSFIERFEDLSAEGKYKRASGASKVVSGTTGPSTTMTISTSPTWGHMSCMAVFSAAAASTTPFYHRRHIGYRNG